MRKTLEDTAKETQAFVYQTAARDDDELLGKLMDDHGVNWALALLLGIACGALIGLGIGLLVAKLGIPSFVVTLAGFLAFQGVLLLLTGAGGTIGYRDSHILAIMNKNMPL